MCDGISCIADELMLVKSLDFNGRLERKIVQQRLGAISFKAGGRGEDRIR